MLNEQERKAYWDGRENKAVRYYFYCQRGLGLLNEFRYLLIAILALYALLKMDNPLLLVAMFFGSVIVLCLLGWIQVHRMSKVMDFLNVKFSTHFSKYQVELQERQNELLKEILDECRLPTKRP